MSGLVDRLATLGELRAKHDDEKRALVEAALRGCEGSRTVAAEALGTTRTYLVRLIRVLGAAAPPAIAAGQGQALARRLRARSAANAVSASR